MAVKKCQKAARINANCLVPSDASGRGTRGQQTVLLLIMNYLGQVLTFQSS